MIRSIKIIFLSFLLALLNGTAMAASFEDVILNIGVISNDLEEDLEEENFHVINGEYDAVGAGGSDQDGITPKTHVQTKQNFFCPTFNFFADSQQAGLFYYKQYGLLLQRSLVVSPLFILYCCAKDALLF